MTFRDAQNQGLHFTGIYEYWFEKDKVKARAAEIRKKYNCRAVVVKEESGYSVYADEKYSDLQCLETCEKHLSYMNTKKADLLKKYQEALAELEIEEQRLIERVNNIKAKY